MGKSSHLINGIEDLGRLIRDYRQQQGLSQAEFAGLCGVGNRFISELENGKPTVRFDKAIQVLQGLGLTLSLELKAWTGK